MDDSEELKQDPQYTSSAISGKSTPAESNEVWKSDDEAENEAPPRFSWKQLYDNGLLKMDDMSWLCHEKQTEIIDKLQDHLTESNQADIANDTTPYISREIFNGLQKVFDICKFWLHYFDQGMKSAWPETRCVVPKSMRDLRKEIMNLMNAMNVKGNKMNKETLNLDLQKYGQNPMKPRLWKLQRAIIGAERIVVYFPL